MQRVQFVGSEGGLWWLLEREVRYDIEERRRQLGGSLGWTYEQWYDEEAKREELYYLIERNQPDLLSELDYVTDPDRQLQWLDQLLLVVAPQAAPGNAASATPVPAEVAPRPAAEQPRKSIFARKTQPEPPPAETQAAQPQAAQPLAAQPQASQPQAANTAPASPAGSASGEASSPETVAMAQVLDGLNENEIKQLASVLDMDVDRLSGLLNEPEFKSRLADMLVSQPQ